MTSSDTAKLALGELRGLISAFEWVNTKCDNSYTFEVEELPPAVDVPAALALHFGEYLVKVIVTQVDDWQEALRGAFRRWLFQYVNQLRPAALFALADPEFQEKMVQIILGRLGLGLQPEVVWRVNAQLCGHYECNLEDYAIEGSNGRYLLHLGVSD